MLERSQSFDIQNKSYDEIQKIMENVLEKDLSLSIKTKRLGRSLLRINYIDSNIDKEQQKDNRITILQESDKRVYVQIKGNLSDAQVRQIWNSLEKNLIKSSYIEKIEKKKYSKLEIIKEIKHLIELEGYIVKEDDVQSFIENFIEKFNRLPEENEFSSIVKGYIIIINEDYLKKKVETPIKNKFPAEREESVLDNIDNEIQANSYNEPTVVLQDSVGRRKCPSCGDESSIHEVVDKSIIIMAYPRIYGKKKYCGLCGYEWK
ncbi:MAG: hypothetical protein ACFFA7_12065 [Promethearchaeota archaeon]